MGLPQSARIDLRGALLGHLKLALLLIVMSRCCRRGVLLMSQSLHLRLLQFQDAAVVVRCTRVVRRVMDGRLRVRAHWVLLVLLG